jgi:hypothetical protein
MFTLPWHVCLLQFVAGLFLANGVPHFVQGMSGQWFQTPFASPRGVGESSPVINVLWGFFNLAVGFALLFAFAPQGRMSSSNGGLSASARSSSRSIWRGISDGCGRGAGSSSDVRLAPRRHGRACPGHPRER